MNLFIYGTLLDDRLRRLVAGCQLDGSPAVLAGYRVEREQGGQLPVLCRGEGDQASGLILKDVPQAALDRLDAYEIPFGYQRITEQISGIPVGVYLPPATMRTDGTAWALANWQATDGPLSLLAAEEIDAHHPALTARELSAQWHMIRHRASSRLRASQPRPSTVRRPAGSVEIVDEAAPYGSFFKYYKMRLRHETFAGQMSDMLPREGFRGADAALILPYDPVRDRVLLVEQFRVGPTLRGDANPWALEPVAGMIDAGETPEQAARREAAEEAGLKVDAIVPMFSGYASPGNSSEYHYCMLALTDLPDRDSYFGGLADEAEDLRLHVVTLDQALEMVETAEISVLPLIAMLNWVARKRSSLRASA